MYYNRFLTGLPTVLTSNRSVLMLISILILIYIPATQAQEQPTDATDEQIPAPLLEGRDQRLLVQEIDAARSELSTLKQKLESVRKENDDLAARLDKQQATERESARELESSRSELADLVQQLGVARNEIADLSERLEKQQVANQRTSEELEEARAKLATAQVQLETNQSEKEKLSAHLTQAREDLDATRKLASDREQAVEALRGELAQLTQSGQKQASEIETLRTTSVDQKKSLVIAAREIESLRLEKQQVQQTAAELQMRLNAIQAELPEAAGGTASIAHLRGASAEALSRLREQTKKLRARPSDRAAVNAYRDAVHNLARRQLKLAWAVDARGLYRVRAKDTLAIVAKRNYGESGKWMHVFKANQHILEDPNRLMPDMTLLIP